MTCKVSLVKDHGILFKFNGMKRFASLERGEDSEIIQLHDGRPRLGNEPILSKSKF